MSLFVVTAVRLHKKGYATALRIGQVDGATRQWIGEPAERPASDVADLILGGDTVEAVFQTDAGLTTGGALKYVGLTDGVETVEMDGEPQEGKRLTDLPRF